MTPPPPHSPAVLWPQFILAAALERMGRDHADGSRSGETLCYVDTHAGGGRIAPPMPHLSRVLDRRDGFLSQAFFAAVTRVPADWGYPGSWVLAAEALAAIPVEYEIDINDLSDAAIEQARQNQRIGRIRYWCHDWFKFLRSRLTMLRPPHFVFIDPPHDSDGASLAMDAAILLDTLKIPYMATYATEAQDETIDLIGRTALELTWGRDRTTGVILGGGAERVALRLLRDLELLAECLDGQFLIRTPHNDDFII